MIKLDTWYIFGNEEDKNMFFDELEEYSIDRDELPEEFHKAQCLRVRETEDGYVLNYRTTYVPQYMRAEYYKGDIMNKQRIVNEHPLLSEYYQEKSEEFANKLKKKIIDIKKASAIGIIAQSFIDEVKKNDPYAVLSLEDFLPDSALCQKDKDAIIKAHEDYDKDIEALSKKCRRISMLLDATDTFEEYNSVLDDYDILKIIK